MRKRLLLNTALILFAVLALGETFRRTTADMYTESYMAAMRRQTGMSIVEVRAKDYRSRYELCDEHHDCTNVTAGSSEEQRARRAQMEKDTRASAMMLRPMAFQ